MGTNKQKPWRKLDSRRVYKNRWLTVREDRVMQPNGIKSIYGIVSLPNSVFIVALTPKNEVYLVRQFRYPTNIYSWEIPAGGMNKEERPLAAAKRELWEETGLKAKRWTACGRFQIRNGFCDDWGYTYAARDLILTPTHKQTEDGIDAMRVIPLREAARLVHHGAISDGQSIVALTKVAATLHLRLIV